MRKVSSENVCTVLELMSMVNTLKCFDGKIYAVCKNNTVVGPFRDTRAASAAVRAQNAVMGIIG